MSETRWALFTDAEVQALLDGLDAWDGEVAALARGQQPHSDLTAQLEAELKRRGLPRR